MYNYFADTAIPGATENKDICMTIIRSSLLEKFVANFCAATSGSGDKKQKQWNSTTCFVDESTKLRVRNFEHTRMTEKSVQIKNVWQKFLN